MKKTKINWANSTFNPWHGCTKVSAGCDNCYAERDDKRMLHERETHWGKGVARYVMADSYWKHPIAWEREAEQECYRPRVFWASMADWADHEAPEDMREKLWDTIRQTPHLDWLLLTKRPRNIRQCLPTDWGDGYSNVWLGVTAENREEGLPRIDMLRTIPAVIRFVSFEPLLEDLGALDLNGIHWAIIGGDTKSNARSLDIEWIRSLLSQCQTQKVAAWVKQLGRVPLEAGNELLILKDDGKRGWIGDNSKFWPQRLDSLLVRQTPELAP